MTMTQDVSDLTPKHVRAARALLAWSQQDLSKAAGVATSTVADFERGQRTPVANNALAIRAALEGAGIRFLPTGAVIGPPLTAGRPPEKAGAPVRWVSAQDLEDWANRTDGAVSLPTLISHLIVATHGDVLVRFPSDEGVRHAGWDGRSRVDRESVYVPAGQSVWELSVQRSKIASKADEDYRKRTEVPGAVKPAETAYVFITARHWPGKAEWAKARQAEGPWREVRVYDADDLVHWIERTPAVGLWLAARLNKRPPGTRELDEVWEEWSLATQWPLTEDLVLSDRDTDAAEVLRWLRGEPSILALQATTSEEVIAFFHATLSELPDDVSAAYRSRCLVATTAEAARALVKAPGGQIILLTVPDPGLARSLTLQGNHVLVAYDQQPIAPGEVRTLARPSREGIASALMDAGVAEPRAKVLARDSARNLAVLRRLMPVAPGGLPRWAEGTPPRALLAALLAGGWDEDGEADRARLADLAGEPYEAVAAALAPYVGAFDSPLQKLGSTWRIASPSDAWLLLAGNLTSADITRFEAVAGAVLSSADPRFNLEPGERWEASIRGIHREYSGMLRHGIGQILIMLALWGDRAHLSPDASRRADAIVRTLLNGADAQRWWSLSDDFRLLAEASPDAFMTAVENSLDRNEPPIKALFGHDDGGVFGTEHLSDLMWALESLGWSPDLMPRVTHILARLDALDTEPRRYSNGPANSLREMHVLWIPQTYAPLTLRLRALDLIRKREPGPAWKLMLNILPKGHDHSSPSPLPRWRDFSVDQEERVTYGLIARGAAAISERLLADAGVSAAKWVDLLDRLSDFAPDAEPALAALEATEDQIHDIADRAVFRDKLRRVLHHHRQFSDAEWSLPEDVLGRLDAVYNRFEPIDRLDRIAWLFENAVTLPRPTSGWEAEEREVDAARVEAAMALHAELGAAGVLALARRIDTAGYVGKALFDGGLEPSEIDALLEVSLCSEDVREHNVAHGLIIAAFRDRREPWAASLIARARTENWGDTALMTILRALPMERWTWDQVEAIGGEIEETYWRRAPVFWMSDDSEDITYAIRRLVDVGRARHALPLAGRPRKKANLPSDLLVELLQEAARQPYETDGDSNEGTMFQHYVAETLEVLDSRADVDRNALITLEWNYLRLLEYSRRPAKVLLRALSEEPSFFIQMLSAVFSPTEESGVVDPTPKDLEQARAVASQAYRLLDLWDRVPGTQEDGSIDGDTLEAWVKEARKLAKAAGREKIGDSRIGAMLSASPTGADGAWPAEPVREVLDLFRSKSMLDGFIVGKRNRRGVTVRMPDDGGQLERSEADVYRAWSKAIAFDHPHTARALDDIAAAYDWEARRHDEDAERLDWLP